MKYLLIATTLFLCACAGEQPQSGEDYKIRAATPGVVDHNVIPKKSRP